MLTIVIPTYNRGDILLKNIDLIVSNAIGSKILILDNCSTTTKDEYVKLHDWIKNQSEIIYIHNDENIGMEGSLYKALEIVETEYALILSDEDIPLPNVHDLLSDFLEKNGEFFALRPSIMSSKDQVFYAEYPELIFEKMEGILRFGLTGNYISGQIYNARLMRRDNIIQAARQANHMLHDYPHLLMNLFCAAAGRTAFVGPPYVQQKDVANVSPSGAPDSWASFYSGPYSYGMRFNQFLGFRDAIKLAYGGHINKSNAAPFYDTYLALCDKYAALLLDSSVKNFLDKGMHPRLVAESFYYFALAALCNLPFSNEVLPQIKIALKAIINKHLNHLGLDDL
jgi:glycosyltransferase involved in cell wall biosynthesis